MYDAPPRLTKSETEQAEKRDLSHICEVKEVKDDVQKVNTLIKGDWELLLAWSRGPICDGRQPITYSLGKSEVSK